MRSEPDPRVFAFSARQSSVARNRNSGTDGGGDGRSGGLVVLLRTLELCWLLGSLVRVVVFGGIVLAFLIGFSVEVFGVQLVGGAQADAPALALSVHAGVGLLGSLFWAAGLVVPLEPILGSGI